MCCFAWIQYQLQLPLLLRLCVRCVDWGRIMDGTYEVRTAVPNRACTDLTQTLQDAGLTPNATLMLRVLP